MWISQKKYDGLVSSIAQLKDDVRNLRSDCSIDDWVNYSYDCHGFISKVPARITFREFADNLCNYLKIDVQKKKEPQKEFVEIKSLTKGTK